MLRKPPLKSENVKQNTNTQTTPYFLVVTEKISDFSARAILDPFFLLLYIPKILINFGREEQIYQLLVYHLRISPAGRHVNWARDSIISPPLSIHAIFYASSVPLVVGGEKQCRTGKINNVFYLFEVFESDENYCTRINVSASSFVNKEN